MQLVLVYLEWFRRNSVLYCSLKSLKNSIKPPIRGVNVVRCRRCWYHWKARRQCLLWCAASLGLSATVFTLDESILVKERFLRGVPLFNALVRGESPHLAAPKLPHYKLQTLGYHMVKTRNRYLTRAWFGTGSWHPRRTDRRTDRIPIANTRLSSTCRY